MRAPGLVHRRERIKQLEEEDERRHQEPLPEALAAQPHHQRHEIERLGLGLGDQPGEVVPRVRDVGIGQQQIAGLRPAFAGPADALLDRPELARPAARQLRRRDHLEGSRAAGAEALGDAPGGVGAVIVDQHDRQFARVVLVEQRAKGAADAGLLVARRHHRDHCRPSRRRERTLVLDPRPGAPEAGAPEQEVDPCQQRKRGKQLQPHHRRHLAGSIAQDKPSG